MKKPSRTYSVDVSIPRNISAELVVYGDIKREDIDLLRVQIARLVEMVNAAFDGEIDGRKKP